MNNMAGQPQNTAETFQSPAVRQISVFLEDRVGALLRLFMAFDGSAVRVVGMTIINEVDCAVVRLICDDGDTARKLLKNKGFAISESELLVVEIPQGQGLMSICSAMIAAEVNINYVYPLMTRPTGRAALAIHTDNLEGAVQVLRARKFVLMSEEDLGSSPPR
jgi:hypothetical protein